MLQKKTYTVTISCYNHTNFHVNRLDSYGEIAQMLLLVHTSISDDLYLHVHFEWSHAKMLIIPKLKELARPRFGLKLALLGAISDLNLM